MIQIELIGCTSAGKSTIARTIVEVGREQGIDIETSNDLVLKQIRLHWVKNRLFRTLCIDAVSLFACLVRVRRNFEFVAFAIPLIIRLPVTWLEKLNLTRNVLKKVGIHEIVRHYGARRQVVLVDEGTLHAAHNLFVHIAAPPNPDDISTFTRLVPLPDAVVYVKQSEAVLIQRTLMRGHKRIPHGSPDAVELFIRRAVDTFDKLGQQPELAKRLLMIDPQREVSPTEHDSDEPPLAIAAALIRASIAALPFESPARRTSFSEGST